jgi:hypothetical protein
MGKGPVTLGDDWREVTWVGLSLTTYELTVLDEIRRRGGFQRVDQAVLSGLYLLARQLDMDVPVGTFAIRSKTP